MNKGFDDVEQMKDNTALDALRQREDFRKLVGEVEGKEKSACHACRQQGDRDSPRKALASRAKS